MSDRYFFEFPCPYCGIVEEVTYAPEWAETHRCLGCGERSNIVLSFTLKPIKWEATDE